MPGLDPGILCIRRTTLQVFDDAVSGLGEISNRIALGLHRLQDGHGAGGCVIAHAIGDAAVLVGIVGKDDRQLAVRRRRAAELHPVGGEVGHELHAVRHLAVGDDPALGALVPQAVSLEGDGAAHDAAVEFGQHDIHREVAGVEALGALPPAFFR